ncbi:MAG TPA: hypothetical protein EYP19_07415 [Desulfobacterales bacterium]|nr:hypothetical protein [Desulfobacterales bacterium]
MKLHSASNTDSSETLSLGPTDAHREDSVQKIAVLITDIVGSTKFFKSHGDVAGQQMLQLHQDMALGCVIEHGGVLVKTEGTSVMAYFPDAKEALKSAIKIQQKTGIHNRKRDSREQIHIKIGIDFGDGIVEHSDIFGNVVNTAAKLTSLADRDQIFISQEAYGLVHDLSEVRVELVSLKDEKGVPGGLTVYKLIPPQENQKNGRHLFLHQKALSEGDNPACYYCGDKKHLAGDCPSKHLPQTTSALEKLGYFSFDTINRLFLNHIAGTRPNPEAGEAPQNDPDGSTLLASYAFYELKRVFQLRFFANIWNASDENWSKIKETGTDEDKGGFLWIALDCLRVSNLAQAETFLESCLAKYPKDYRSYCAMGFLNVERNDFPRAEYYFDKALEYAKTKPQRIFLLFLLSRLYDVNDRPFKASEKTKEILSINSHCEDARYQDIVFKFREEKNSEALRRLIKLIQEDREYYVKALIDPDFAPFSQIIHGELKGLFDQAKNEAMQIFHKAENELNKLEGLVGEREIKEAQSLWEKIRELPKADSYFGYLDILYYGGSILALTHGAIGRRRGNVLEVLYGLNSRVEKHLAFLRNYPYQYLVGALYRQLRGLQTKIDQTRDMAKGDILDEFKEALGRDEELSAELGQIDTKLKRLEALRLAVLFCTRFLKKSLLFQSAVVCLSIIVFPIVTYYLNLILPRHGISPIVNIWFYQKGILVFGAMSALSWV